MRLLPRRDPFSRLAWVWLIYLVFLVRPGGQDTWSIAATIGGVAFFLPLYFWGQWLHGRRALLPIAGITAIGLILFPINSGASVFFVYAGTFAGRVGGLRIAAAILAGLVVLLVVEAWSWAVQFRAWGWPAAIIVLVGGVVAWATDAGGKLRVAQEQARHMAVIAERERIGRDLHDLLGHTLSVIALKAELASKLASRDPEKAFAEIRDVERISREALSEVRRAVQPSRPASLEEELRKSRTALDAAGIELACDISPAPIDPASEEALALAAREAVTNVIRHSSARHCEIRLRSADGFARLDISDDGIGGDLTEGSGLSGMRTRITQLGGRLEREGGAGTKITITVPLRIAPSSPRAEAERIA